MTPDNFPSSEELHLTVAPWQAAIGWGVMVALSLIALGLVAQLKARPWYVALAGLCAWMFHALFSPLQMQSMGLINDMRPLIELEAKSWMATGAADYATLYCAFLATPCVVSAFFPLLFVGGVCMGGYQWALQNTQTIDDLLDTPLGYARWRYKRLLVRWRQGQQRLRQWLEQRRNRRKRTEVPNTEQKPDCGFTSDL